MRRLDAQGTGGRQRQTEVTVGVRHGPAMGIKQTDMGASDGAPIGINDRTRAFALLRGEKDGKNKNEKDRKKNTGAEHDEPFGMADRSLADQ